MPYYMQVIEAGKTREVYKLYSSRLGVKGVPRAGNTLPTSEEMESVNLKNAEKRLRWLINANYQGGDYHLTLSYRGQYTRTPEEARKDLERFLRGMRRLYHRLGKVFRYITVTERGSRMHRIHHHVLVGYIDSREISRLWPWGRIAFKPFDDSGQYGALASYLLKFTRNSYKDGSNGFRKRWNASKNLKQPKIRNIIMSANQWRKEPRPPKGYYVEKDKTYNGISRVTGYPVQFYSMVRLPDPKRRI